MEKTFRDERTYQIIGAAMEVHRELGSGFLEPVYQEAMEREMTSRGIQFQSQLEIRVTYKGEILKKTYQPDFVCFERVIVEIKALSTFSGAEEAQVLNYLKASGFTVGLLINFGAKSLEYKRLVLSNRSPYSSSACSSS
jgi:GxxExxY protein